MSLQVTSTSISFRPLQLNELDEQDLRDLKRAFEEDPFGDASTLHRDLSEGRAVAWRLESERGRVLFILKEQIRHGSEKVLLVWYMAGKGALPFTRFLVETLVEYAKLRDCSKVVAITKPVLGRYLKRFGFESDQVSITREVK